MQDKTTLVLLANHALNAGTGVAFWLVLIHVAGLDAAAIGIGYTIVAVGTAVGLVAKGGLGTALMRHAASAANGRALLWNAVGAGAAMSVAGVVALGAFAGVLALRFGWLEWALVAGIAVLLMIAWLQDAYFLARGRPQATLWRTAAFSTGKLLLPVPLVLLAFPSPVAAAWCASLVLAALVGVVVMSRTALATGPPATRRVFFRSAWRNVLGNAAEFLPGLLLVPIVLSLAGAAAAGYFGMAWTAASLLFLAVTAIGRSALAQMVRGADHQATVKRGLLQASVLVLPAAVAAMLLAPWVLGVFGADYVAAAAPAFIILAASTFFLVPTYLYLDLLRAREEVRTLNLLPLVMMVLLFTLAPILTIRYGLLGAALAWAASSLPFGVFAAHRLVKSMEVNHAAPVAGHPDVE